MDAKTCEQMNQFPRPLEHSNATPRLPLHSECSGKGIGKNVRATTSSMMVNISSHATHKKTNTAHCIHRPRRTRHPTENYRQCRPQVLSAHSIKNTRLRNTQHSRLHARRTNTKNALMEMSSQTHPTYEPRPEIRGRADWQKAAMRHQKGRRSGGCDYVSRSEQMYCPPRPGMWWASRRGCQNRGWKRADKTGMSCGQPDGDRDPVGTRRQREEHNPHCAQFGS